MLSYVLATRYLYRTAHALTKNRVAGVPSRAEGYSPPTPTCCTCRQADVGSAADRLHQRDDLPPGALVPDGRVPAAGRHRRRYAARLAHQLRWPGCVDLAVIAAIAWVAWRRQPGAGLPARRHRAQADLVFYATLGCSGIAAWLVWNQALFHNALHFQNGSSPGPHSGYPGRRRPSGISASPRARTCTRWPTTSAGWRWDSPWPGWSATSRVSRHRADTVAPLTVLVIIPFCVRPLLGRRPAAARTGQREPGQCPLRRPRHHPGGVVRSATCRSSPRAGDHAGGGPVATRRCCPPRPPRQHSPRRVASPPSPKRRPSRRLAAQRADDQAAAWLRAHYHGGAVLMESSGNETEAFESRIPLSSIIYEGSRPAVAARASAPPPPTASGGSSCGALQGDPDQVWQQLHGRPALARYALVYSDPDHLIYTERPQP